MIEILDLTKYSFFASCIIFALYKLIISIVLFDKKDPFNDEKRDYLNAEEKEPKLRYLRIAGFILFGASLYFGILYVVPI